MLALLQFQPVDVDHLKAHVGNDFDKILEAQPVVATPQPDDLTQLPLQVRQEVLAHQLIHQLADVG